MRKVPKNIPVIWLGAAVTLLLSSLWGCGNDSGGDSGMVKPGSSKLTVESIIFDPKSPAPGDTMTATAVVTSPTPNIGDFATYTWSSNGGAFVETNKSTVRWVAPDTATVFSVSVTVRNSVSTAQRSETVFVSRLVPRIQSRATDIHVSSTGDSLWYLAADFPPSSNSFSGFEIRLTAPGSNVPVNNRFGGEYVFDRNLTRAAHVEQRFVGFQGFIIEVFLDDLASGTSTVLPTTPFTLRPPAFFEPEFTPDGQFVAYSGFVPDQIDPPSQGGVDTFEVFIYDIATQQATRATSTFTNFHPSFSSDGNHLVFLSDRASSQQWELYALPFTAGSVPPDTLAQLVQLTNTGGAMGSADAIPGIGQNAWNPNPATPILAIVDQNDNLNLVPTDGSGAITVSVPGKVKDLVWTKAGDRLAMTTGGTIYTVTLAGAAANVLDLPKGDKASRLSWSSDGNYIMYNVVRQNSSWFEVIDIGGATGLTAPIKVTARTAKGDVADYEALVSTRSVWAPDKPTVYVLFFDGATPRLSALNLSGLAP